MSKKILIIDGYKKQGRDDLVNAGMTPAYELHANLLMKYLPTAKYDILFISDPDASIPTGVALKDYDGIIWTGCNLTVVNPDSVIRGHVDLAKEAFSLGIPSSGSCWALQVATVAAGGEVGLNPLGREILFGRNISVTAEGRKHEYMEGKPEIYEAFMSHDDHVTKIAPGTTILASNDHSQVQAAEIVHEKGTFWSIQYHPEYNLVEMAALLKARKDKLTELGFFIGDDDFSERVSSMEALAKDPARKDLIWKLGISQSILDDNLREIEFSNWLKYQVCTS